MRARGYWGYCWFLRAQYAVGFTQYALGGVFEYCDLLVHRFTEFLSLILGSSQICCEWLSFWVIEFPTSYFLHCTFKIYYLLSWLLTFVSRGYCWFLRAQYAVGFTQYALDGLLSTAINLFTSSQVHKIPLADLRDFAELLSNHSKPKA